MVVTVKGKHDAWSGPTSDTQMWQSADRETLLYISCDTDTSCSSKRLNTTLIHDDGRIHGSFWCIVAALKDQSYWPRGGCKQRLDLKRCDKQKGHGEAAEGKQTLVLRVKPSHRRALVKWR